MTCLYIGQSQDALDVMSMSLSTPTNAVGLFRSFPQLLDCGGSSKLDLFGKTQFVVMEERRKKKHPLMYGLLAFFVHVICSM